MSAGSVFGRFDGGGDRALRLGERARFGDGERARLDAGSVS